jgi:hypothetical protein
MMKNSKAVDQSQDTTKNYKSSILSNKRSISPVSNKINIKGVSPASVKKRSTLSKSRPKEKKYQ